MPINNSKPTNGKQSAILIQPEGILDEYGYQHLIKPEDQFDRDARKEKTNKFEFGSNRASTMGRLRANYSGYALDNRELKEGIKQHLLLRYKDDFPESTLIESSLRRAWIPDKIVKSFIAPHHISTIDELLVIVDRFHIDLMGATPGSPLVRLPK